MGYAPEAQWAAQGSSWADNGNVVLGEAGSPWHAEPPLSGGAGLGAPQPNPEAGQHDYGPQAGTEQAERTGNVIGRPPGNAEDVNRWPSGAVRTARTEEVASYTQPLIAERARGVDGAGGHPHARHRIQQYQRPWAFDHADGWTEEGANFRGLHVLEVPGATEPGGFGPGTIALPQPLNTRVPPPRWDEAYRYGPNGQLAAAQDASTSGL